MPAIRWTDQARSDVRRLDRPTAMRHRFMDTEEGDVQRLKGTRNEFRLRVGNYRLRFQHEGGTIHILRVLHRSEAYR